uniref:Uncharacterized protein n=1 Tax=Nelumbo nucifera TaxID=4432 RepID=A0A822ZPH9_NELNU|nr:TPA_asm: hypothetical protein HUJ06_003479 [Nelumbo nucifera]
MPFRYHSRTLVKQPHAALVPRVGDLLVGAHHITCLILCFCYLCGVHIHKIKTWTLVPCLMNPMSEVLCLNGLTHKHLQMSTFTMVHHTAPHIPFKSSDEWNAAQAQLNGTVHCNYPHW